MSKSPSTSTSTTVRRNQDQTRSDQTRPDQTRPDREHQTENIECRVRPNPLLARRDEEERLRYQWDENKNLEKRGDKFNILVTLFRAGSLTPLGVRALQRKLNLLLTLFWYPFFHMCLPALPASSLTSLCRPKYSALFFKFALFSSSQ